MLACRKATLTDGRRRPDPGVMLDQPRGRLPFKPEFTIVIFIHYNFRLVVDVDEDDLQLAKTWSKLAYVYW